MLQLAMGKQRARTPEMGRLDAEAVINGKVIPLKVKGAELTPFERRCGGTSIDWRWN